MFYRLDKNGKIKDSAKFKYAQDCLETDKTIVTTFDGKLVFREETETEEYENKRIEFENKNTKHQRIEELKEKLSKYDYIGIKIATGRATKEEYANEIQQMIEWANEINQLEEGM